MFEDLEFGVSSSLVQNNETIDLPYDDAFMDAMDAAADTQDFADVITGKLLMLLREAEVDTTRHPDLAGEFDVDYLTLWGYTIDVKYNKKDALGRHRWIEDVAALFSYIATGSSEHALLSLIHEQSWDDHLSDFADDPRKIWEKYIGAFDYKETAAKQYAEDYYEFDSDGIMAGWIDWDKFTHHLENQEGITFVEDSEGMVHMWRDE